MDLHPLILQIVHSFRYPNDLDCHKYNYKIEYWQIQEHCGKLLYILSDTNGILYYDYEEAQAIH